MKKKAVVAMSGGVDSSVAAALMVERGWDAVGVTLKLLARERSASRVRGTAAPVPERVTSRVTLLVTP